jgi:broad specificity phosphatase PhoE
MTVERVLLIRHGETDWNADGRWQGFELVALNEKGLQQASKLALHLQTRPIGDICTSDLPRAVQTAEVLAQELNLTPKLDPRLRELHLGIFQGLTRAEIEERYPAEFEANRLDYLDNIIPNGESRRQLQARAYDALTDLLEEANGPEVVVVSHGGTIRLLLLKLFESDAPALAKVNFTNTSITTIERTGSYWRLVGLAATPHLIE